MAVVWAVVLGGARAGLARGDHAIDNDQLEVEMARNRALAAYVARNGKPDIAESRELADRSPWDDHEVTLYYLDAKKEIAFARAWILGRPSVHLEHYERPLSDADVAALSKRALRKPGASERPRMEPRAGGDPSATVKPPASASVSASADPTERAEAAAQRAEAAAGRLEAAAAEAEHAADRAEASIAGMENAVKTARPKSTVQTARRK